MDRIVENKETSVSPDKPTRGDLATASLYKTVLLLERERQLGSGMMYRPDLDKMNNSFKDLFDFQYAKENLGQDGFDFAEKQVGNLLRILNDFEETKLKEGYQTSHPKAPMNDWQPNEICRFVDPHLGNDTPYAVVYLTNEGELKYRLAKGKALEEEVFDLNNQNPLISTGTITRIEDTPKEFLEKLTKVLTSDEFKQQWDEVQSSTHIHPKTSLLTVNID
jgi:hypothetical protein